MAADNDPIMTRLEALMADYRQQLPERMQTIERLFTALQKTTAEQSNLKALHLALHKLAGSGAAFGYSELGKLARQWEALLQPYIENQSLPSPQKCDEMHRFINLLLQAASTPDEN